MSVRTDEIVGPVISIARLSSLSDATALINRNTEANGVAIFTRPTTRSLSGELDDQEFSEVDTEAAFARLPRRAIA